MKLAISEIINQTALMETDEEQIEWLKKHDNPILRAILKFWYHPEIEFLIPPTAPPYKPLAHDNYGILYGKAKLLPIFVKGGTGENLHPWKREMKFIELLEQVHADDAKILCLMIAKKPLDFLEYKVIRSAFPEILP